MPDSVSDHILTRLSPIYPVSTFVPGNVGSVGELLKRWAAAEGISLAPKALWDRYTLAGAAGASIQDKAYDFWSKGLLKSGVKLPGTAGNYLSSPDSVLNSITGDIDIRICAKLDDWTPALTSTLIAKRQDGLGSNCYGLRVINNGALLFDVSNGSNVVTNRFSTVATGFADGAVGWVRATLDVDNGAGGNDAKFYTSSDGITWTQLGTTVTTAGVVSLFDGAAPIELGSRNAGVNDLLIGTIYYAEVRNGIDGPVVSKFDSSKISISGSNTPSVLNGWSVNGSAVRKVDDYIRLPSGGSGYLLYPDTVVNSIAGDIDIRCKVAADDWTPGTIHYFMSKYINTGNQISWLFNVSNSGALGFSWSPDGTAASTINVVASVATGFTDGSVHWIRATLDVDNGAAGSDVKFYVSDDGVVWTQLGITRITAGVTSIFDSTSQLQIAGYNNNGSGTTTTFNVYAAEVRNGINGPVVAKFDARDIETPWTINGSGWSYEGTSFQGKKATALSLPGTAGEYASTPDSAANSITGDIDIRVKAALVDWGANSQALVAKWSGAGTKSYLFLIGGNGGRPTLYASSDGTASPLTECPTVPGYANGAVGWVRVTRVQSSGLTTFYKSNDGITWTSLGETTLLAGLALFDAATDLRIGQQQNSWWLNGTIYYAEVRNGIDGPIVAKFDASAIARTGTRLPTITNQPGGSPNLLTPNQASLETDTTGWFNEVNATLARSTAQFLDGAASLAVTSVAIGITAIRTAVGTPGVPVVARKMYTFRINSRAATVGRTTTPYIKWYTAAGAEISGANGGAVANNATGWTEASATLLAPALAAYAAVQLNIDGTLAAEIHYVDRVSLVETATPWTINGTAWDWVEVAA